MRPRRGYGVRRGAGTARRPAPSRRSRAPRRAAAWLAAILALLAGAGAARADDFVVYSPKVVAGLNELEWRGFVNADPAPALGGEYAYQASFAHAFTNWWKPEVYFLGIAHDPGSAPRFTGFEFENTFQLAPTGEYWADPGLLVSYALDTRGGGHDTIEFGPLFEKQVGRFTHRLNLIWEKQVGAGAAGRYFFRAAYGVDYRLRAALRPGVEVYLRPGDDSYQAGPVLSGEWRLGNAGSEVDYHLGVVLGINRAAPDATFIARLEYDFF